MPDTLPNLLIVGAQKGGTTWLHAALCRSEKVAGPPKKELDFFNRPDPEADLGWYRAQFDAAAPLRVESTPHYFRLPRGASDAAAAIRRIVPGAALVVSLRDPVERYLSACTHHMMRGRVPYAPVLEAPLDAHGLLELGRYADILAHWRAAGHDPLVVLHDDIVADGPGVLARVAGHVGVDLDVAAADLDFRINDKRRKLARHRRRGAWPADRPLPRLSEGLRAELAALYAPQVARLAGMIGRDLSHWARPA